MIELSAMRPEDWSSVAAIYREGIATGHATFETETPAWEAVGCSPPSVSAMGCARRGRDWRVGGAQPGFDAARVCRRG